MAGEVWSGLSRTALKAGFTKTTALWQSLRETLSTTAPESTSAHIFVIGQDRPDAIDAMGAVDDGPVPHLYACEHHIPDKPSTLAGSLLY